MVYHIPYDHLKKPSEGCSKHITACTENITSCCHILKAEDDTFDTGNVSYLYF